MLHNYPNSQELVSQNLKKFHPIGRLYTRQDVTIIKVLLIYWHKLIKYKYFLVYNLDTSLVPKVLESFQMVGVKHEPLKLIPPQFETTLPGLQVAIFPPQFCALPPGLPLRSNCTISTRNSLVNAIDWLNSLIVVMTMTWNITSSKRVMYST